MRGFCILSFSLLFLVAKFSNPIWPGPLFHVKQHFWRIFFLLSVFLFNVSRETIVNWNNVSLWIGRWWYEFVIRLFVCVYNLWVALFWDFGIRSWRNFLLFFIAVIEFEDADFFCWKWQIVLFHYAWRLNNVFREWMSFVATLSQASWSILYLWEKLSDWKTFSYTFLRPGWIVCCIRKVIFFVFAISS